VTKEVELFKIKFENDMVLSDITLSSSIKMGNCVNKYLKYRVEIDNTNFKQLKEEVIMKTKCRGKGHQVEDANKQSIDFSRSRI